MSIPVVNKHEPAFSVVEKLGGKSAVAAALELDKSTISRWCTARPAGTGGMIPQRYWPRLMQMARTQRVRLSMKELMQFEA